jgi:oligopeptide/dipeptide ABC transporter ATP-binding protein
MYAGRQVEHGSVDEIFYESAHPYTQGLLASLPRLTGDEDDELRAIPGAPPSLLRVPSGCAFHPRCAHAERGRCDVDVPELRSVSGSHGSACLRLGELDELPAPLEPAS